MSQIHPKYDNETFISRIISRAVNRRINEEKKTGGRRSFIGYRSQSDLCYAYSVESGNYYVGYSSISGGMFGNKGFLGEQEQNLGNPKKVTDADLPARRLARLELAMEGRARTDPMNLHRSIANCAEACAYSIAISYGEQIENLFFVSFYRIKNNRSLIKNGESRLKPPCQNCKTWLGEAHGYWEGGIVLRQN